MIASFGCSSFGVGFLLQKPLSPKPVALSYRFTTPTRSSFRWIGAKVLSMRTDGTRLTKPTMVNDLERYSGSYLFLDPDVGIRACGKGSTRQVDAQQLADIARVRNGKIVLVFDQSYQPEKDLPRNRVAHKLQILRDDHNLHSGAVIVRTHPRLTCYVWVSTDHDPVDHLQDRILRELPIPDRFLVPWHH